MIQRTDIDPYSTFDVYVLEQGKQWHTDCRTINAHVDGGKALAQAYRVWRRDNYRTVEVWVRPAGVLLFRLGDAPEDTVR